MFVILRCCLALLRLFRPVASLGVALYALSSQEPITLKSDKDCPWFMLQIEHYYFFFHYTRARKPACETCSAFPLFDRKLSAMTRHFILLCSNCRWYLKRISSDISTFRSPFWHVRTARSPAAPSPSPARAVSLSKNSLTVKNRLCHPKSILAILKFISSPYFVVEETDRELVPKFSRSSS